MIECLKQACTGSLPPTCSKQRAAFIHDPKISGQAETRAQIKLRFMARNGNPVVLVKSFLLTVKGNSTTFKASDQTIKTIDESGRQEALSCKVQDIEKLVPTLMGASQAVLDSVVFVHQDESNWPLDDPLTVKKKFDNIFNLSGYTKAVDAMKKVRLHNVHEVDKHKLKVGHLKTYMERAQTLKKEIANDEDSIKQMNKVIDEFDEKSSIFTEEMKELEEKVSTYKSLLKDLEIAKGKKDVLKESSEALFDKLEEEAKEDIEELLLMKNSMDRQLSEERMQLKKEGVRLDRYRDEEGSLRDKVRENETLESRLIAEIDVNRREIKEVRAKCEILAKRCVGEDAWDSSVTNDGIVDIYTTMRQKSRDKQARLKGMKEDARRMQEKLSDCVKEAQTKVYQIEEKINSTRTRRDENLERIDEIERWRKGIQINEEDHQKNEAIGKTLNSKLKAALETQKKLKEGNVLENLEIKIEILEKECEDLRKEKDVIQESSGKQALYYEKSKELKKIKEKSDTLINSNKSKLQKALGSEDDLPEIDDLMDRIQARSKEVEKKKEENMMEKNRVQSKIESLLNELEDKEKAIKKLKAECGEKEAAIGDTDSLSTDLSIEDLCRKKEEKLEKLNEKINHMGALDLVFDQYIKRSSEIHACPACKRDFHGEEEEDFIQNQKQSKGSIPQRLQQAKDARDKMQKSIDELRSKTNLLEDLKERRKELLECETEHSIKSEMKEESETRLKALTDEAGKLTESLKTIQLMLQEVAIPSRALLTSINEMEADLKSEKEGLLLKNSKTLDEVKEALVKSEKDLKSSMKDKEDHRLVVMKANEEVGECERSLREHREMVAKAEGNAVELKTKLNQKEKLEKENLEFEKQKEELSKNLTKAKASLSEVKLDSDEKSTDMNNKLDACQEETRGFLGDTESMKNHCEKLANHGIEKKEQQLSTLQRKQEDVKIEMEKLGTEVAKMEEKIKSKDQNIREHEFHARNIDDNISYKKCIEECEKAEKSIKALKVRIDSMPSGDKMNQKLQGAKAKYEENMRKTQYMRGSRKTLEQKIEERREELRSKEFRNIEEIFKRENLSLKTKTLAISDIDNYVKALKKALVSFHNRKMANINKTIKELWQKTYRNSDIDYIQIKYEESGSRGSHNYRVQMISGGTELDMRGRCSAGQRVLASIIIRLALAETFCIDCGILALDEPTTNLDQENSRSLAIMLQQIIKERSAQSNFQLIV